MELFIDAPLMYLPKAVDALFDGWCERHVLFGPLQRLLPAYPSPLAHTDQKHQLLEALRDVKGLCRSDLT